MAKESLQTLQNLQDSECDHNMKTIQDMVYELERGLDLKHDEAGHLVHEMLSGTTTNEQNVQILTVLADKGETEDELLGMLDVMQEFAVRVKLDDYGTHDPGILPPAIDMCGTGGDGLDTFNISTAASFVVAAAGGRVAKHGNRSNSSMLGSADIFEYFGYDLNMGPEQVANILERYGICFMFAQMYHPAMRHVAAARRLLPKGTSTAFNALGPLANPAQVEDQLIGTSSLHLGDTISKLLLTRAKRQKAQHGGHSPAKTTVMIVHSQSGLDELSTTTNNHVTSLINGETLHKQQLNPESVGLHTSHLADIQVASKQDALNSFVGSLNNTANRAMIETVALNAAGGLVVSRIADDFEEGVQMALHTIHNGKAFSLLEIFVAGVCGGTDILQQTVEDCEKRGR